VYNGALIMEKRVDGKRVDGHQSQVRCTNNLREDIASL